MYAQFLRITGEIPPAQPQLYVYFDFFLYTIVKHICVMVAGKRQVVRFIAVNVGRVMMRRNFHIICISVVGIVWIVQSLFLHTIKEIQYADLVVEADMWRQQRAQR